MDATTLRSRLRLGEDSRTEFKRADDDVLAKITKTLVAFANSGGGELFLGVEDNGAPTGFGGTKKADDWMNRITGACQTSIEPAFSCRIHKVEVDGHLVLVVEVPAWPPNRPYGIKGKYYVRDAAAKFLDLHVPAPEAIEGWTRKETGIPAVVLREALHNALAHRDYVMASHTHLFVLDDRVEITNPGTLLNKMTLDSIRIGGISQQRNPAIAAILQRSGLVELASTGVPRMIEAMRKARLPEPDFSLQGGHFRVILRARPAEAA